LKGKEMAKLEFNIYDAVAAVEEAELLDRLNETRQPSEYTHKPVKMTKRQISHAVGRLYNIAYSGGGNGFGRKYTTRYKDQKAGIDPLY
tara:strand:- start:187 stop:453 length:267 start_codon:yes stop_codon:yes gene_type:complete